jgi:hypothetical protein
MRRKTRLATAEDRRIGPLGDFDHNGLVPALGGEILLQPLAELGDLHPDDGVLSRVVVRVAAENLNPDLVFPDAASGIGRFAVAEEQKQPTQTARSSKRGTRRYPFYEKVP